MKEERMYILDMLNDGKITAAEAEALLKALGSRINMERISRCGTKIVDYAKEKEPAVRNMAHNIADKSADVMESLGKTIKEKTSSQV